MASIAELVKKMRAENISDDDAYDALSIRPEMKGVSRDEFKSAFPWSGTQTAEREGSIVDDALVRGVASIAGVPRDLHDLGNTLVDKYLPASVAPYIKDITNAGPVGAAASILPTGQDVSNFVTRGENALGFHPVSEGDMSPGEKYLSAGAKGIGAAVPIVLSGGASAPEALGLVSSGGVSGLTAEAAHQYAPDSFWAPIIGGLAGGFLNFATLGPAMAKNARTALDAAMGNITHQEAAEKIAADTMGEAQKGMDAAKQAKEDLAATHKDQLLAKQNDVDAKAAQAQLLANETKAGAQQTIDSHVAASGGPLSQQAAGEVIQPLAKKFLGDKEDATGALLNPLYEQADALGAKADASKFKGVLDQLSKGSGSMQDFSRSLVPMLPQRWKSLFEAKAADDTGQLPAIPLRDMQQFRTDVGESMKDPSIKVDAGRTQKAAIYSVLTDTLKDAFDSVGLGDKWEAANAKVKDLNDFARNTIGKIVESEKGATDPTPESVVGRMVRDAKSGGTDLQALRQNTPEIADALARHVLSHDKWQDLSQEAKTALVPDAAKRAELDGAHATKASADASAASATAQAKQELGALRDKHATAALDAQINLTQKTRDFNAKKDALAVLQDQGKGLQEKLQAAKDLVAQRSSFSPPSIRNVATAGLGGEVYGVAEHLKNVADHLQSVWETTGPHIMNALSLPGEATDAAKWAAGALAGGAPLAWEAMKYAIKNPSVLRAPLVGGLTGNALAPTGDSGGSVPGARGPLELTVRPRVPSQ